MKVQLIDVKTNSYEARTGTCEYCFGSRWVDEPIYIYSVDGKRYEIAMYEWDWGSYYETIVDNVIEYADWLNKQTFDDVSEENIEIFLFMLVDQYNELKRKR